jgi:Nicotinate phosphoribosyltransferase (NAPRTase) N-terminal domain/Nicotinate phosphoribosyltransferase (NAPRTase) family
MGWAVQRSAGSVTDLYELNMAVVYLRRGMRTAATFSLFVRQLPADRGFLVASGLADCLEFLARFGFSTDELDWLEANLGLDQATLDAFAELGFTGEVWAVPEGRVVLAGEPLLEVTAPIAEAQLVETALLNEVTFQTAVASKAARCRQAADGADLVDFAFRRTQGVDAAMAVARATAMVGFVTTSNVAAARRFRLPAAGTMAHSFIEAFEDERTAFRAFAGEFPTGPRSWSTPTTPLAGSGPPSRSSVSLACVSGSVFASILAIWPSWRSPPAGCWTRPACRRCGSSPAVGWTSMSSPTWSPAERPSMPTAWAPRWGSRPMLRIWTRPTSWSPTAGDR